MLVPDKPIYRNDEEDGEHYIQFSKETIRKMVEKFNRNNNKSINDDHTNKMVNLFLFKLDYRKILLWINQNSMDMI